MKVRIIGHGDINNWILGKFARKLEEYLSIQGVEVSIANETDSSADINHHITHYERLLPLSGIQTQMVTHIDTIQKFNILKQQLNVAEMGICMSRETVDKLSSAGVPRSKLCFVNPSHDSIMIPRRKRIGITCRVQEDGRKREWFLGDLADYLEPVDFEFFVMGDGWLPQVKRMKKKGFLITYYPEFEYDKYIRLIPSLDYYLYFGEDEGQMGFIDALAAGVETIVTPQGYHLDVDDGISYPFHSFDELLKIFYKISEKRKHLSNKVTEWNWQNYTQKHIEIWQYLMDVRSGFIISSMDSEKKNCVNLILSDHGNNTQMKSQKNVAFLFQLFTGYINRKAHIFFWKMKHLYLIPNKIKTKIEKFKRTMNDRR